MCIDPADNELETLQIIHHYVEILDRYFGNVRPPKSFPYTPPALRPIFLMDAVFAILHAGL